MTIASNVLGTESGPTPPDHRLVGPEWLEAHLDDPTVRIVELDVSPAAYDQGHIDGAVLWNIYRDIKDDDYRLIPSESFVDLLRRSGIRTNSTVVFYGSAPAIGLWLLQLNGHADARILDCSRETWQLEGRPWSVDQPDLVAREYRLGQPEVGLRVEFAEVRDAANRPAVTLLDVRTKPEFDGECFWPSGAMEPEGRAGHIPSAIHRPLDGLYDERGAFRSPEELHRIFTAATVDGDDELITYCTIGGRAATAWFVLTHLLGRQKVRVYDGSWAEWGHTPGAPVESY